jgi:hypothetical protein
MERFLSQYATRQLTSVFNWQAHLLWSAGSQMLRKRPQEVLYRICANELVGI